MRHRVVVTGLGVVCALGHDATCFWESLRAGRSGIEPIEGADRTQLRFQNGAEVRGFDSSRYFAQRDIDLLDRFAQFWRSEERRVGKECMPVCRDRKSTRLNSSHMPVSRMPSSA